MERRLRMNALGPLKPVERGTENNRLVWCEGSAQEHALSAAGRKLLKKIRTKKRRAFKGVPSI